MARRATSARWSDVVRRQITLNTSAAMNSAEVRGMVAAESRRLRDEAIQSGRTTGTIYTTRVNGVVGGDPVPYILRAGSMSSTLSRGIDASTIAFLKMGRSVDEVSRGIIQLQQAESRLAQMQVMASSVVAGGSMSSDDVNGQIANQQAQVDRLKQEVEAVRAARGAVDDLTEAHAQSLSVMQLLGASVDEVTRKTIDLQRAEVNLATAQKESGGAVASGKMSQADADAIVSGYQKEVDALGREVAAARKARDATDVLTHSHKLSGYQVGILADEVHKFADQVLAGGSAMQAAFYQAPNAIATMGGLKNAIGLVGAALSGPVGIAAAAVVAVGSLAAVGVAAESEQSHLASLSQHLRATRSDYEAMSVSAEATARQIAAHGDMSLSDSRTTVETFAAVPTVDASQLTRLTLDTRNLAAAMRDPPPPRRFFMPGVLMSDPAITPQP
ncbi:hypothetical protein [Gluconacetobacter sp.]|uniref:hypothetical protein n=1 Tax=Gluconacetobacter sp. TaxID=1935994 RepID=UPI0039EC7459